MMIDMSKNKISTKPYKGVSDYYPEEFRLRAWLFAKWRETCQSFGYEEYDASVLEPIEMYTAKTSEEIVNEQTFNFEDRGGRKVTLRPEMTPTVSRMVAGKRQELGYPLRLFSIPVCFRYERMQRGRNREFFQLNLDLFGIDGVEADIENIQVADAIMRNFGATEEMYTIKVNSRRLINKVLELAESSDESALVQLIDRKNKVSADEFNSELADLCKNPNLVSEFLSADLDKLPENIKETAAWQELSNALSSLNNIGVNAVFDASIARGFDYYTGIVFEVFDNNPDNNRSMFGGGRYDGLVGEFGVEPVPTVGCAMGDATLYNFLEENNLVPELSATTDIVVLPINLTVSQVNRVAVELRQKAVNLAVDYTERKIEKRIKAAQKNGVKYVLFVGEQELANDEYRLKNIETGADQVMTISQVVDSVNS